eukprot:1912832-Rhodomonas_salina.2
MGASALVKGGHRSGILGRNKGHWLEGVGRGDMASVQPPQGPGKRHGPDDISLEIECRTAILAAQQAQAAFLGDGESQPKTTRRGCGSLLCIAVTLPSQDSF